MKQFPLTSVRLITTAGGWIAAVCLLLSVMVSNLRAESVQEKTSGTEAYMDKGESAKSMLDVSEKKGASNGQLARVKGSVEQWNFVSYWFGTPVAGGSPITLRFRIYNDGAPTAEFAVYVYGKSDQVMVGSLKIPANTPKDTFVDMNLTVSSSDEWSGIAVKKTDDSGKPGPWIDTISVITP